MSQLSRIRDHLKTGRALTPVQALDMFGCFRLAARIKDLREAGYQIHTERFATPHGAVIARYWMKT